ncbi:hypothetical protein [Allorhodopirellula solitaria]|uniref:Apea-like HEPN domain-containing protein n=1 Tax=Allorhodopirellula solitaria TaxID=2527987 RepID=A0A5C5X2V2_9BACT|nr:hypothetical protein [Allorhodopirellula solitaria]TWT56591.1 hypothetical protein CA85_41250 [Allorhodopirellula solitaria]
MSETRSNRSGRHEKHLELAAELIRKNRRPSDGTTTSIAFSSTEPYFQDVCELLSHSYRFHHDVSAHNCHNIIQSSLFEIAKESDSNKITPKSIDHCIAANERKYRRTRRTPHFLFTQISIDIGTKLPQRVKVADGTVCFSEIRQKHAPTSEHYSRQLKSLGIHQDQPEWYYATIRVDARDSAEAASKAFRSINLLRSIWNFSAQAGLQSRHSSPTPTPINPIRLGPLQTSHAEASGPVIQNWWYQNPFVAMDYPGRPSYYTDDEVVFYRQQEKWLLRNLTKCSYADIIETNLINYTIALDSSHHLEIYPNLWAVLESLSGCGTDGQMNYDRLIKRTVNAFAHPNEKKTILAHLRILRNQMIHDLRGATTPQSMFMLLRCVHGLLFFCLRTCTQFKNVSELHTFLDLPSDGDRLKTDIRLRKMKLKQLSADRQNSDAVVEHEHKSRGPEHIRIERATDSGNVEQTKE